MPRRACLLLGLFSLALASACAEEAPAEKSPAPSPAPTWKIQLDRPARPGQRFTLSATGTQDRHTKTTSPTQPSEVTAEHLEITYAAIHEIKATNPAGHPTEVLIRIDRLTTNDGSGPIEQFPAGSLVTATAEGDLTRYHLGRDELDGTLVDALNLAGAKLPSSPEVSEDAVFQNHTARQPGDRWKADPARLAEAISATTTLTIDPVTSIGEIHFDEPVTENGIPSLATTTTYDIAPIALRDSPDQSLVQSSLKSTTSRIHPLDASLPLLKEEMRTEMKLVRRPKSGPPNHGSEVTFKRQVTRRYHPLTTPEPASKD